MPLKSVTRQAVMLSSGASRPSRAAISSADAPHVVSTTVLRLHEQMDGVIAEALSWPAWILAQQQQQQQQQQHTLGNAADATVSLCTSQSPTLWTPVLGPHSASRWTPHLLSSSVMSRRCSSDWSDLRLTLPRGPTVVTTPSRSTSAWRTSGCCQAAHLRVRSSALLTVERACAAIDADMLCDEMLLCTPLQVCSML